MDPNNANQNGQGQGAGNGATPPAGDPNINNQNGTPPQNGNQGQGNGSTPPAGNPPAGNSEGQGNGQGVQLTDEQLAAAFNHPRFKSLNERAKKADELEKQAQEAAEAAAKEQGKFEDLYKTANERATTLEAQLKQTRIENAVTLEAAKLGVVDPAAAVKLLDQSGISVGEDGAISGVAEALKALQEASPYLFKTPAQGSVGSGNTNPGAGNNQAAEFTYSQIQDLAFYKANQAAIDKAVAEGRVDMSK